MKETLTFDDILLIPKYSEIKHRSSCDTKTKVTKNYTLDIPIVSSPMDTITGMDLC